MIISSYPRDGTLCSYCAENYYRRGQNCQRCPNADDDSSGGQAAVVLMLSMSLVGAGRVYS